MPLNTEKAKEKSGTQFTDYCYHVTERTTAFQYIKPGGFKSAADRGETTVKTGSFADNKKKDEADYKKRELSKYLLLVVQKFHAKSNKLANKQALPAALEEIKKCKAGTLPPPTGLGWSASGKFTTLDEKGTDTGIPMRCDDKPYADTVERGLKAYYGVYGQTHTPPTTPGAFTLTGIVAFRNDPAVTNVVAALVTSISDHYLTQLATCATDWHYNIEEAILLRHTYFFPASDFSSIQGYANDKTDPVLLRVPKSLLPGLVKDPSQGGAWMTPDSVLPKDIEVWLPGTESWGSISTWAG